MSLESQTLVPAPYQTKIRLSILAKAMVDALGSPAEFKQRFSFEKVDRMLPNHSFGVPAGTWTDDTSMALCLARSLCDRGFDLSHQLQLYSEWQDEGYMSATGYCFDIGLTIARALRLYGESKRNGEKALELIKSQLSDERSGGNGSLMRVLPVGLAYWRDEKNARYLGGESSLTTHPTYLTVESCQVWSVAIAKIVRAANDRKPMTKLQLLEFFVHYPYHRNSKLRGSLTLPANAPKPPQDRSELEGFYRQHHPLLQLVAASQSPALRDSGSLNIPTAKALPSSGYVLHTLVAALFCFFATNTFEEGAIFAVNLGDDADTVGAIYGGLAGAWYASEEDSDLFMSGRVKHWKKDLVKLDLVEKVARDLAKYSESLA